MSKINSKKATLGVCIISMAMTGCQTAQMPQSDNVLSHSDTHNTIAQTSTQVEPVSYGDDLFYSYAFKTSDLYEPQTMKAVGGKLVYREGCLQLFNGSKYVTPIFPNAVTTFDKQTQTLEMLQVTFNMQDMIVAGGYQTSSKSYLEEYGNKIVTKAPERCLLDDIMLLSGVPSNMGRVEDGLDD